VKIFFLRIQESHDVFRYHRTDNGDLELLAILQFARLNDVPSPRERIVHHPKTVKQARRLLTTAPQPDHPHTPQAGLLDDLGGDPVLRFHEEFELGRTDQVSQFLRIVLHSVRFDFPTAGWRLGVPPDASHDNIPHEVNLGLALSPIFVQHRQSKATGGAIRPCDEAIY
jgi:hypothetical protein